MTLTLPPTYHHSPYLLFHPVPVRLGNRSYSHRSELRRGTLSTLSLKRRGTQTFASWLFGKNNLTFRRLHRLEFIQAQGDCANQWQ